MPALTIPDLNEGKVMMDFTKKFVLSPNSTELDPAGQTRNTLKGLELYAIQQTDAAVAGLNAAAAITATGQNRAAAEAAAGVASSAAALTVSEKNAAMAAGLTFESTAAGLASGKVAAGQQFFTRTADPQVMNRWTNTAGVAVADGQVRIADAAKLVATDTRSIATRQLAESTWRDGTGLTYPGPVALLFKSGALGAFVDFNDVSSAFKLADGVVPDAAAESAIGKVLDRAGRGFNAVQPTTANRPLLTTRKNLITRSQELNSGNWTKSAVTITADAFMAPDGTMTMDKIVEDATNAAHSCRQAIPNLPAGDVAVSTHARAAGRDWCVLVPTTGPQSAAWFDLVNGVVGTTQAGVKKAEIEEASPGIWRIGVTFSHAATGNDSVEIRPATGDGVTAYLGDGVSGIGCWGWEVDSRFGMGPYQYAYDATTFNAAVGRTRVVYDGGKSLTLNFPVALGANCTVVRAVRGLGAQFLTGQNIGTTFTDTENSDALLVINRPLTASETDILKRFFAQSLGLSSPTSGTGYAVTDFLLDGVNARITTSDGYGNGQPDTLMLLCHGNGKNYTYQPSANFRTWARANKVSFACISQQDAANPPFTNAASGWGNDIARNRIQKLYYHLLANYKLHPSVVLVGDSMGGLVMGQLAYYKPFPIRFCLGIGPVPGLAYIFANEAVAGARKVPIRNAYGMAAGGGDDASLATFISGYDWMDLGMSSDAQPRKFGFPRMHIYAGTGDTTYTNDFGGAVNYPLIRDSIRRAGGFCRFTAVAGVGHDADSLFDNVLADGIMVKELG